MAGEPRNDGLADIRIEEAGVTGQGKQLLDLVKQLQSVHTGHVDVGEDRDEGGPDFTREPIQCIHARSGVMQGIGPLASFTKKLLPKSSATSGSSSTT